MVTEQTSAGTDGQKSEKKRKPRSRFYKGKHPQPERNLVGEMWLAGAWEKVHEVEADGTEWVVYERGSMQSNDWLDIRVIAKYGAKDKASYWMSWSLREKRFARGRDAALMAEHRPSLREAVSAHLAAPAPAGDPSRAI